MEVKMSDENRRHHSHQLVTGVIVHFVSPPGGSWRINFYEWSWLDHRVLRTKEVAASGRGWEDTEFDSLDDACAFVEEKLKTHGSLIEA